ncbi:MAG: hypothetical protein CVU11_08565 [Bacteroidetes bacterium HGW-Bacteroidetes-6]|jgi:hypothetical protein|nr:MAG: hypothetical protein CVU11_08565 [Bacteroidetes bacterium HGW-Bacteroidetes-6]
MKTSIFAAYLLLMLNVLSLSAQESLLQKKISISAANEPIEVFLKRLSLLSNAEFSYNSDIVAENTLVTVSAVEQSVDKILQQCFGKEYLFRTVGNHIVILKKTGRPESNKETGITTFSGRVLDSKTLLPLANTTIFDMAFMQSALTDSSGKFSVAIKPRTNKIAFRFSKVGYRDTLFIVNAQSTKLFDVYLNKIPDTIPKLAMKIATGIQISDTGSMIIVEKFVVQEMLINSFNTFIADKRIAQLSLLPQWGTNRRMSGSVVNHFSINLLAGYSYGVSGVEIGGVANINQKNVNGLQLGAVMNITGGDVNGFQAAGLLNRNIGKMNGFQVSCVSNTVADTICGVQLSGLSNVAHSDVYGCQVSFVSNIAKGNHTGSQIGGLFNYALRPRFQLGLINIADTSDGFPIGVINIIKHGYYSVSFVTDELLYGTVLFGMGTSKMHSYLGLSARSVNGNNSWGFCYGLGSQLMPQRKIGFSVMLLATIISPGTGFDQSTISRATLSVMPDIRIVKSCYLAFGPTTNMFVSASNNAFVDEVIGEMISTRGWSSSSITTQYHLWFGVQSRFRLVL